MRSNNTLPAIWKAGKVMPSSRKIHWPDRANRMRTPAATRQARRAMRSRDDTESRGVMAINAGIVAIGSTITNSELSANKQYATRFMSVSESAGPKLGGTGRIVNAKTLLDRLHEIHAWEWSAGL